MKRLFDVFASATGLVLLAPLFGTLTLLQLITQGRPVFFGQSRVGRYGVVFTIWKFRTMVPNAAAMGLSVTARADPRITRLGRILRRTKLDELPQLWNVLHGDMSLVGPRPEVPKYVSFYNSKQRRILDIRPGITDLATLEFVDEESLLATASDAESFYLNDCLPKKIALNLEYAGRATLLSDIGILIRTVLCLLRCKCVTGFIKRHFIFGGSGRE